jgi:hypothetical protein
VCDEAGLKGLSAHGLRHATGRSLAEAGCTEKQIAAILGHNLADQLRLVSTYVDRILRGAKPADLPVQQPTKVEMILNLKTGKTLGLTVPLPLLGRADEVYSNRRPFAALHILLFTFGRHGR